MLGKYLFEFICIYDIKNVKHFLIHLHNRQYDHRHHDHRRLPFSFVANDGIVCLYVRNNKLMF